MEGGASHSPEKMQQHFYNAFNTLKHTGTERFRVGERVTLAAGSTRKHYSVIEKGDVGEVIKDDGTHYLPFQIKAIAGKKPGDIGWYGFDDIDLIVPRFVIFLFLLVSAVRSRCGGGTHAAAETFCNLLLAARVPPMHADQRTVTGCQPQLVSNMTCTFPAVCLTT
jgi:hypothetical protein